MVRTKKFRIIPNYGDLNDPDIRAKYGYLEATVSIIGNVGLFLLKLFLGLFINSIALIADGVHSLSDTATSGVVIFGFKSAKKPPDKEHPYGHGRVEYIATLIIAIILVLVAFSFIQQSIEKIMNPEPFIHQEYALIIAIIVIISAVVKELMARYSASISRRIQSDMLYVDAWHHRSDAISSIGVAIGILGARYGFPILDPIFGLFVSVIIIYVGINLIRTSSNFLIGKGPDQELIKQIEKISNKTEDVIGIHDISIHDYGTTKILTLHAEINSNLSLDEAHKIADNLEKNIQFKTNYSTIIHLDPIKLNIEIKNGKNIIETILNKQKEIISFHKIQIIHGIRNDHIKMHLIVDKDMSVEDSHELCHRLKSIFEKAYESCDVDIHFEPCGKDCKICTISCQKRII